MDSASGSELQPIRAPAAGEPRPAPKAVTLLTVVHGWPADVERWLLSAFTHTRADFEALVVDNSGDPRVAAIKARAAERLRFIKLEPPLGFGAAVNAGIEAAAGEVVVLFDPGVELRGDAISPLLDALSDPAVAVAGAFGLRAAPGLKEFLESEEPVVDAVEGYCMAFRRTDALAVGGFDPRFRFYRIADIEFSFRLRDHGGRAVVVSGLPLEKHEHRLWESTEPRERERLSKRNMYRFLDRWRSRTDLLVSK